jgi:hypothetical protein
MNASNAKYNVPSAKLRKTLHSLCAGLLLFCSATHAEEWMETVNEAGGKILFLNSLCANSTTGRMVIASARDGTTMHGCWYFFADMVHVVWIGQGGKTSAYDPKNLTYRRGE